LNKSLTILSKHSGHEGKPAVMLNFTYNLKIAELIKTKLSQLSGARALKLVCGEGVLIKAIEIR
jgi:hypothetical protein